MRDLFGMAGDSMKHMKVEYYQTPSEMCNYIQMRLYLPKLFDAKKIYDSRTHEQLCVMYEQAKRDQSVEVRKAIGKILLASIESGK